MPDRAGKYREILNGAGKYREMPDGAGKYRMGRVSARKIVNLSVHVNQNC
ncbi:MAG: hypothetical protein ACI4ET_14120 [Bilifractor sp.]